MISYFNIASEDNSESPVVYLYNNLAVYHMIISVRPCLICV